MNNIKNDLVFEPVPDIAPALSPDDLVMPVVNFEDVIFRFCIECKEPIICYCSDLSQCNLLNDCFAENVRRNELNISISQHP